MPAPNFDQIARAERDALILGCGSRELALRMWNEVVRPMVDSAETWGMHANSVVARASRRRYGKGLKVHMNAVAKKATELRALLDDDTMQQLVLPPSNVHWVDDFDERQARNIQRVRDLRRLLDELVFEVVIPRPDHDTGEVQSLALWGHDRTGDGEIDFEKGPLQHRLDCFLASAVVRWAESCELPKTPEHLLGHIFTALHLGGRNGPRSGADAIRGARTRRLLPDDTDTDHKTRNAP